MKIYDPGLPLISVHIPKCAGSSFSDVLKLWFKRNYLGHYHNEKTNTPPVKYDLSEDPLTQKPRFGLCIHGHFNNDRGNGISDYYPGAGQIITILRHPFNLHLSTYFYVKREALTEGGGAYRSGKPHPIIQSNWNLREYLTNCKKSYIMSFLPPEITLDNYHSILENRFLYIGVSEKLQPAVDMLSEILGFPPVTVPRRNVSEWSEKIPDGALEEFEEKNSLEMSIYKYAQSHWGNNIDGDQG